MRDERGFTIIELMIVVMIIGILVVIALPTFLGARTRAYDRAAQSDVRNAFAAEKAFYTDDLLYTTDPATMTVDRGGDHLSSQETRPWSSTWCTSTSTRSPTRSTCPR